MSARDAVTALRRFGLGARPGEVKRIAGDPRGYVLQSLTEPGRVRIALRDRAASARLLSALDKTL